MSLLVEQETEIGLSLECFWCFFKKVGLPSKTHWVIFGYEPVCLRPALL